MPIGRYLRIAGDTKVYSVLEAKTMPARNTSYELKVYPKLRADAAVDAAVDFTPSMLARWHPDTIGIEPEEEENRGAVIVNYLCRFAEARLMLATSTAFKTAMKSGDYTRVDYVFLFRAGADPAQTYATADGRWAEVDYGHPHIFTNPRVNFLQRGDIQEWAPPSERPLAGRDLGQLYLIDPDRTWRSYFDRNGWVGHRVEVIWDYRFGDGMHQIVEFYMGFTAGGEWGEDERFGRRCVMRMTGPFTQLDPNLASNLTAAQQKGLRDPGDTSLDDLAEAWEIRIGRKPGE